MKKSSGCSVDQGISAGSNHNSSASLALAMASSSVSPTEAQPGSSGKTEEYRPVSGSFSTIRRSFMTAMITMRDENVLGWHREKDPMDFLKSTYEAGANLAKWDRKALVNEEIE